MISIHCDQVLVRSRETGAGCVSPPAVGTAPPHWHPQFDLVRFVMHVSSSSSDPQQHCWVLWLPGQTNTLVISSCCLPACLTLASIQKNTFIKNTFWKHNQTVSLGAVTGFEGDGDGEVQDRSYRPQGLSSRPVQTGSGSGEDHSCSHWDAKAVSVLRCVLFRVGRKTEKSSCCSTQASKLSCLTPARLV